MSHLIEEYAKNLGCKIGKPCIDNHFFPLIFNNYITLQTTKKFQARDYDHWSLVVAILKMYLKDIKIVQVGSNEDPKCPNVDLSLLGVTSFKNLNYIISKSRLHLGIDSVGVHIASALDVPVVGLYSNMLSSQSGPVWGDKSKSVCIQADRKGLKPSYSANENPKTINNIKPEQVASSVLNLLGVDNDLEYYKTLNIGAFYTNKLLEVVPDFIPDPSFVPQDVINVRCDYFDSDEFLKFWINKKVNLMVSRKIELGMLQHFRGSIAGMTIFLEDENFDPEYLKVLNNLNINFNLICRDKEKLSDLRLKFFDWTVEEYTKNTKKNIDFDSEICDNTFYHSNKTIISKGKSYYSKAAWKAGIEIDQSDQQIIDCDDFWEEIEHLNIFNHAKNKKSDD